MRLKKLTVKVLLEKGPSQPLDDMDEVVKQYPYYDADSNDLRMYSEGYARAKGYELPEEDV